MFSTAQSRVHHTNQGNYGDNMKKVACFNDLISFATAWKNMPHSHMAKLFYDHQTGSVPFWKKGEESEIRINALSLFMANVKPEWEDEVNKQGGEFRISFFASLPTLQKLWERAVFDIVSRNFAEIDLLAGVRFLDKSTDRRPCNFRIEVWTKFNSEESEMGRTLKAYLVENFCKVISADGAELGYSVIGDKKDALQGCEFTQHNK